MNSSVVNLGNIQLLRTRAATLGAIAIVVALVMSPRLSVEGQFFSEYDRYVYTYTNSEFFGNLTYLEKPVFPVVLRDSQVPVGQNWTIVAPLVANRSYHVYCYGRWIDNSSTPRTDYDIYVYNRLGEMESYHTEAAGLPEHLGTTVDEPLFAPKHTGNYTFVIVNDPRESKGAQEATFMIIEDVECNAWHQHYVEGKNNNEVPVLNTSWAYEFTTESQRVEVYIRVPETLDMYEARLYLMFDPSSMNRSILNGVPLAWEPGLFGNRSSTNNLVGGYNLESKEYRGVTYASCEFYGQDMFVNFTSPFRGKNLCHLVLMGEAGSGMVDFLVKTEFGNARLKPSMTLGRVYPYENVTVAYMSNSSELRNATLEYSIDSWRNTNATDMVVSNRTCTTVIPGQAAGISVSYTVTAYDILENTLTVNGSYAVKHNSVINFSQVPPEVRLGENLTVTGLFTPQIGGIPLAVCLSQGNRTEETTCFTLEDGTFRTSFKPETTGTWVLYARFNGSSSVYENESTLTMIRVEEPLLSKYSYYILGALGAVVAIGTAVYVKKSKP